MTDQPAEPPRCRHGNVLGNCPQQLSRGCPDWDAEVARRSFGEPGSRWGERRSGREGRSIPHSYGGEGFNNVD